MGAEILRNKKLFVFDMDGTIYLGAKAFPEAIDFIGKLKNSGRRVLFFTNNASHNHEFYLSKLKRMGFPADDGDIMSSADVTASFLNLERPGKKVYLLGTPELYAQFRQAGIQMICDENGRVTDGGNADIVVSSFDTTLTYEKLTVACDFIRSGAEYLSTHPDFNCPTETGFIPDSGAIAAAITASTGRTPRYFGKPYADTARMICEMTGTAKDDMCIIGDRLYTDIATGKKHGITAVLVLTGETLLADVEEAADDEKPDIILRDLDEASRSMFSE